jgi:adrenodoxin-NADP+ reductase
VKLPSVAFHPINASLMPEDISKLPRAPRRIMEVLKKGSAASVTSSSKSWSLDFCLSPTEFTSNSASPSRIGGIAFEKTGLIPDPFDPSAKARGTGEIMNIDSSVAFRSIGYKSEGLPGFTELGIPFNDDLGLIPNDHQGRVIDNHEAKSDAGVHRPGMYCAGWVKRGPTGVIASTMQDAFATADAIAEDWHSHAPFLNADMGGSGLGWDGVRDEAERRGCRRVSWRDWQKIDAAEKRNGQEKGKEREKFTRIDDMLAVLD